MMYKIKNFRLLIPIGFISTCLLGNSLPENLIHKSPTHSPIKRELVSPTNREEVKADLSNTPWSWDRKKGMYEFLFKSSRKSSDSDTRKPLPRMQNEEVEIVEFSSLGLPLKGAYTLKEPPSPEQSTSEKLGAKLLTFLLNHFSLQDKDLPVVPKDHNTLVNIIFPDSYHQLIPRPSFPEELKNIHDIVGSCALSGPFANMIRKGHSQDINGCPGSWDNVSFYVIDLDSYTQFSVEQGVEKLGGKAILTYNFSTQKMETKFIQYGGVWYSPTDSFWPQLQRIMMATQTTDTAMVRHLLYTHVLTAGLFSAITHKVFSAEHPVREFLYPHQFGTIATNNYKLPILISGEGSMFPALFSFDQQGSINLLQKKIDTFDLTMLDVPMNLQQREMMPEQRKNITYPYADITLRLWDLTGQYVKTVIDAIYDTEEKWTQDTKLKEFYDALEKYIPNNQLKKYASEFSKENIIRLLTLHIYNESVEHYVVGTMTYHFQPWAVEVPFTVKKDGSLPSIGEAQNAANLLFATQPSYAYTEIDRPSDLLQHTYLKKALRDYQSELLKIQQDIDQSMRGKAVSRFNVEAIQAAVNS